MKERNEKRLGYEKTKVGWIPEEWKVANFRSACATIMDGTHFSPKTKTGPYRYITSRNIRSGYLDLSVCQFISEEEHFAIYSRCPVKKGQLLLTKDGASTGNACLNLLNEPFSLLSSVAVLDGQDDLLLNEYALHWILSPHGLFLIRNEMAGQAITRLTLQTIGLLELPLPPLTEQKKIAEILSIWAEAIEQTRKLIEAKKRCKKALMQQLLTGKRLYRSCEHDNWNVKPLGDIIKPVSRPVPKPQNPYLSIGIRSHGKGTFQKTVEQPEKVMMDTLYRIESNDLIVNITFAWEGAIAIVSEQDSGGLVSHRFPTYRFRKTEADIDFFRNLILTKKFVWDLGLISPGGAGRNRVLSQKDFLKLKVFVPSVPVQKETGEILAAADKELDLCEDYLKALEKQKRGLMQKLLTGEVRIES